MRQELFWIVLVGAWGCGAGDTLATRDFDCSLIEGTESLDDLHCGSIEVSEDHFSPDGRTLEITYVVLEATNRETDKHPLVVLSGGPGAKTLNRERLSRWASHPIRGDRDIVLFDQRGVGYSSALPDMSAELFEVLATDADEAQETVLVGSVIRKYKDICTEKGIELEHYNTFQSARDTAVVMKQLGYGRYNLYATSYGTRLARVVQSEYPELVHAAIQNSPNSILEDFLGGRLEAYSLALERVLEHCRQDVDCARFNPELESSYLAAIRSLIKEPLTIDFRGREFVVNAQDGTYLMRRALYRESALELAPRVIRELQGDGSDTLVDLLDYEWGLNELINYSMLMSVERYETFDPSSLPSSIDGIYSRLPLLPVRLGFFDSFYRVGMKWHDANLPRAARVFKPSDLPTLILVNQFDPATPPESARRFQVGLANSRLLILDQASHGGGQQECRDQVMVQFLNNPTKEIDVSCLRLIEHSGSMLN